MHGEIHAILKDLVLQLAGEEVWDQIVHEAGYQDDKRILRGGMHDDDMSYALVGATCKVTGLTAEEALTAFGKHFVAWVIRQGSASFLKAQGTTLPAFIANINNLHNHLERDHPTARFPFIETKFETGSDEVLVTYLSARPGLAKVAQGILEEIGRLLYNVEVEMVPQKVPPDMEEAAAEDRAAAFKLSWKSLPTPAKPLEEALNMETEKVPIFKLHELAMEFGKLLYNPPHCVDRCACGPEGGGGEGGEANRIQTPRRSVKSVASLAKVAQVASRGTTPARKLLMRGVPAGSVSASWSDSSLSRCRPFWLAAVGHGVDYELSDDVETADAFISHSWSAPENWELMMGEDVSHADFKSTTCAVMAKDIALAEGRLDSWGQVTFWIDKACIPQDIPELKMQCILLIEYFISQCRSICVIFTWSYLERLWCVFEWACFLVDKEPGDIYLQNEFFVKEETLPLYLETVRHFSLARCKCAVEGDRKILQEKISEFYVSTQAFEELVKVTAIALMARSMAYRAAKSSRLSDFYFAPWVELAEDLGFTELSVALRGCDPNEWRAEAVITAKSSSVSDGVCVLYGVSGTKYHGCINDWFEAEVSPILQQYRDRSIWTDDFYTL